MNQRRLDTPSDGRRRFSANIDADVIGVYAERVARFLGTGSYLAIQTVVVIVWIFLNIGVFTFGEYGFEKGSANGCGGLMLSFMLLGK